MDELLRRLDKQSQREQQELSPEFLQTLAQELALTAETMNFELTDLAVAGYREALSDLRPDQLRRGFKRARRTLNFFPKPNEVRECAYAEWQDEQPTKYYLPEAEPRWTEEDRKQWGEEMQETFAKIKKLGADKSLGSRVIIKESYTVPVIIRTPESDARATRMIEEVKAKHPEAFTPEKVDAARELFERKTP